ncbi:hypothetical protein [Zhihengliuella halotolerans]|uniref:Uncharacterized protein n=1 Tax=Zhihengliuella halotolerans TaxID=370736 RepID=A0A4Q8ACH5_9MICC|nr:hypothetical protein [Zhihengliuella halotolerans]RZU61774.1 hypothetical protein EV380_1352 [Zhihengliuella halotolerans]
MKNLIKQGGLGHAVLIASMTFVLVLTERVRREERGDVPGWVMITLMTRT